MLEEVIKDMTATMKLLIAELKSGKGVATAGKTASDPTEVSVAKVPRITMEMVKVAVVKVKDAKGKPAAQKIIKDVGKAAELLAIKSPQFKAVLDACEALLGEEEPEAEESEESEEDEDSL